MPQESHPRRSPSGGASRPASSSSNPKPRRRRRKKHMNPLLYVLMVLSISALLAGIGWIWAGDVLALNKPAASAVITLPSDIFTPREVKSEVTTNGVT